MSLLLNNTKIVVVLGTGENFEEYILDVFGPGTRFARNRRVESKLHSGREVAKEYLAINKLIENNVLFNNKVKLEVSRNHYIYRDSKVVQGIRIDGDFIEFTGYHFTSKEAVNSIVRDLQFKITNINDPYIYFVEPGWFSGKTESEIKHVLGASVAEQVVIVKIRYPIEKIFIKAEKGKPLKIAVNSNINQFDLIKRGGVLIESKPLSDL